MERKAFAITSHCGFHWKLPNGFCMSVQWGPGNYSDHHSVLFSEYGSPAKTDWWASDRVEVAVFDPGGDFLRTTHDDVQGYLSSADVLELLKAVSEYDPSWRRKTIPKDKWFHPHDDEAEQRQWDEEEGEDASKAKEEDSPAE